MPARLRGSGLLSSGHFGGQESPGGFLDLPVDRRIGLGEERQDRPHVGHARQGHRRVQHPDRVVALAESFERQENFEQALGSEQAIAAAEEEYK